MRRALRRGTALAAACLLGALGGCRHRPPPPPPPITYLLEPAWQAGGVWFYPHEVFSFDQTGIATVIGPGHAKLTANNEVYDPQAMAAEMQSVQLPAIAVVTDLDTGREVRLRVNERGPADPARLIAVTPRVATLLGMRGDAEVRVRFDSAATMALRSQVEGRAADLPIDTAPRGAVQQTALAPLAGTTQEAARAVRGGPAVVQSAAPEEAAAIPQRLPEQVVQGAPQPGLLLIDLGSFTHADAAARRVAGLADVGARVLRSRSGGQTTYAVQAGPYQTIADADAAFRRVLQDGVTDARLVVDLR